MSNCKIFWDDYFSVGGLKFSTEHPNFPASNLQERRLLNSWHSAHGEQTGGGQFVIDDTNYILYFTEQGGSILSCPILQGTYTATSLAEKIQSCMTESGNHVYSVTYSFDTLKFYLVDETGLFALNGGQMTSSIMSTIGFDNMYYPYASSFVSDYTRIHTREYIISSSGGSVEGVFVFGHNVQSEAKIKIELSDDKDFEPGTVDVSYTVNSYNGNSGIVFPRPINNQYVRIWIEDPGNPDGYVRIGRVLSFRTALEPNPGFSTGDSVSYRDLSSSNKSLGGSVFTIKRKQFKEKRYNFDIAEPIEDFQDFYNDVGESLPFVFVEKNFSSNDYENIERGIFYCTISRFSLTRKAGSRKSLSMSLREEL